MRPFALLVLTGSALLMASCEARFDWPWLNKNDGHHASGTIVTEERTIAAFTEVDLEGMGKLVFDASIAAGTLRITADSEVMKDIDTKVERSVLRISDDGLHLNPGDIEFRLAPPDKLSQVTLNGMGSIETSAPITTKELCVILEGMGRINIEVEADSVKADQQGMGELVIRGTSASVSIVADGLGKVDTSALVTSTAEVQSDGVGEVLVYASDKLKVRANGVGAVHFSGNPKTTDIQTEGLTQVKAVD